MLEPGMILAAGLAMSGDAAIAHDATDTSGDGRVIIVPTEHCRGYFFIPVTLSPRPGYPEDRTLWFIYDTGASATYVDPDSINRVSNIETRSGGRVNILDATSGPLNFNRLPARVGELEHLSKALGREIDGIMAFDAFDDFLMTLDYENMQIRLETGELPRPDNVTVFNASGPDDRPWMMIRFSNRDRRMLIDSGAALASLVVRRIDRFETQTDPVPVGASMRLTRVEPRTGARASGDARMGPHVLETPTLTSTPGTELIGGDVMMHFNWTFDQRNERVRIERHDGDGPITFGSLYGHGIVFENHEDGFFVRDVIDQSPADEAGIQAGDIITHFNGQPLMRRDCNTPAGQGLTMTLVRNGEVRTVALNMRPLVE